jgi:hypothetical protein
MTPIFLSNRILAAITASRRTDTRPQATHGASP